MAAAARLGYAVMQVNDLAGFVEFGESILGFKDGGFEENGARFLRMDEAPFRFMIVPGDEDKFLAAGWECDSKSDFEAIAQNLKAADATVEIASNQDAKIRKVEALARSSDPSGNSFEFYHGREGGAPFTPGLGISKFETGDMGLGHCVLPAPDTDATHNFYKDVMGFGDSDDLSLPPFAEGMPDQRVIFLHANNPRHHSLGLYNFPNPVGLIHLMVEVQTIDEVGQCLDRVKQAGLPLMADLGRHSNDNMVSFYFFAPGGFCFEVGYDGKQISDWSKFTPTKSTTGDIWGHEYNMPDMG